MRFIKAWSWYVLFFISRDKIKLIVDPDNLKHLSFFFFETAKFLYKWKFKFRGEPAIITSV